MRLRNLFCAFLLISTSFVLTACDSDNDPNAGDSSTAVTQTTADWRPEAVSYTCADDASCPDNQGVLLSIKTVVTYDYLYKTTRWFTGRCTATVYDSNKILTAGHCIEDMKDADHIYFKTVAKPGRPSEIYNVSATALAFAKTDLVSPDYAALQLDRPVTGVRYARPVETLSDDPQEMVALVSNPIDGNQKNLTLNAIHCRQFESLLNPVTYIHNPQRFMVQDCKIRQGNSGGSVVLPSDLTAVLGVVDTGPKDDKPAATATSSDTAGATDIYRTDFGGISNARCFSLPGWPQVQSNCGIANATTYNDTHAEYGNRQLGNAVLAKVAEEQAEATAPEVGENARLHLTFQPFSMGAEPFSNSPKTKSIVLMPLPSCFIDRLPSTAERLTFTYPAKILTPTTDTEARQHVVDGASRFSATIVVQLIAQDRYSVSYEIPDYDLYTRLEVNSTAAPMIQNRDRSVDVQIPVCDASVAAADKATLSDRTASFVKKFNADAMPALDTN